MTRSYQNIWAKFNYDLQKKGNGKDIKSENAILLATNMHSTL